MNKLSFIILFFCFSLVCNAQTIVCSTTSLSGFTYTTGAGPSAQKSFIVSGSSLSSGITISVPTDYEISAFSGTSFIGSSSLTISRSGNVVNNTTIYIRLKAGLASNAYIGTLTLASYSALSKSISLNGNVYNPSTIISTSISSLSGFTYPTNFGPSVIQSFTVSGTNLIGSINIAAPSNFEISLTSGASFVGTNSINLYPANGALTTTTIYIRLVSGLSANSYSGNLILTSQDALEKTVSLSAIITQSPTIGISTTDLSGFIYKLATGPSLEKSFTVTGTGLTTSITITPSTNYQISLTSGASFVSTPIILSNTGGIISPKIVYVRLKSGLTINSYSETISLVSSGAVSQNVNCSGSVVSTGSLIVSTNTIDFYYEFEKSFSVSGYGLTSSIIVSAPTNFEISTESGYLFTGSSQILLSRTNSFLIETPIYIRVKEGLPPYTIYSGDITILCPGVVSKSISIFSNNYTTNIRETQSKISIISFPNNIKVKGVNMGEQINIYNTNGILIKSISATEGENKIRINVNGLYIVKVAGVVKKIIL